MLFRSLTRSSVLGVALLGVFAQSAAAVPYYPFDPNATDKELGLLVYTNQARAVNGSLRPVMWDAKLHDAAAYHSQDIVDHGGDCPGDRDQHYSCNGQDYQTRIAGFYGSDQVGEVLAMDLGQSPEQMIDGWLSSPPHRSVILNGAYSHYGSGIRYGQTWTGQYGQATADFGWKGNLSDSLIAPIPAAVVLPRIGGTESRKLVANYFGEGQQAPRSVKAIVGASCVNLSLQTDSASNGTYGASRSFTGSGCVPVVFEAIKADGERVLFPQSGAILVGVGAGGASCASYSATELPTADCGNGKVPVGGTQPPAMGPSMSVLPINVAMQSGTTKAKVNISIKAENLGNAASKVEASYVITAPDGRKLKGKAKTDITGVANFKPVSIDRVKKAGHYNVVITGLRKITGVKGAKPAPIDFGTVASDFTVPGM